MKETAINNNTIEEQNYITLRIPRFNKTQVILLVIVALVSFFSGSFWTKIQYLEKTRALESANTAFAANNPSGNTPQAAQAAPSEDTSPKKVSVDDDPVLGDNNAKVTMIEFVDYECPFCKRFYDQTLSQIKKEYIDTGKVKLVMRDLPLSFHQNAHKESQAAECAREQGGDSAYFQYHDEIFKRTTSNGTGLALDQLPIIATDIGLDGYALQQCLDTEKYKAEVDKDLADAATYGATGTPSFFIGKSTADGIIEGTPIVGAQPISAFKAEIEKLL